MVILKFPSKARPSVREPGDQARPGLIVLMKNAAYLQYFSLIFQEENHNILLLLRISWDSNPINPGIPYFLGFVIYSDSHI